MHTGKKLKSKTKLLSTQYEFNLESSLVDSEIFIHYLTFITEIKTKYWEKGELHDKLFKADTKTLGLPLLLQNEKRLFICLEVYKNSCESSTIKLTLMIAQILQKEFICSTPPLWKKYWKGLKEKPEITEHELLNLIYEKVAEHIACNIVKKQKSLLVDMFFSTGMLKKFLDYILFWDTNNNIIEDFYKNIVEEGDTQFIHERLFWPNFETVTKPRSEEQNIPYYKKLDSMVKFDDLFPTPLTLSIFIKECEKHRDSDYAQFKDELVTNLKRCNLDDFENWNNYWQKMPLSVSKPKLLNFIFTAISFYISHTLTILLKLREKTGSMQLVCLNFNHKTLDDIEYIQEQIIESEYPHGILQVENQKYTCIYSIMACGFVEMKKINCDHLKSNHYIVSGRNLHYYDGKMTVLIPTSDQVFSKVINVFSTYNNKELTLRQIQAMNKLVGHIHKVQIVKLKDKEVLEFANQLFIEGQRININPQEGKKIYGLFKNCELWYRNFKPKISEFAEIDTSLFIYIPDELLYFDVHRHTLTSYPLKNFQIEEFNRRFPDKKDRLINEENKVDKEWIIQFIKRQGYTFDTEFPTNPQKTKSSSTLFHSGDRLNVPKLSLSSRAWEGSSPRRG